MSLKRTWMLLVSLLFVVEFVGRADAEEQALTEIKKIGGSYQVYTEINQIEGSRRLDIKRQMVTVHFRAAPSQWQAIRWCV